MAVSTENQLINKIALDVIEISKISIGDTLIYSAGNTVTYHVDDEITYQEEVDADETVLSPKTFIPEKVGWEFVGWRKDIVASADVLSDLVMDDDPIELYAVFQQTAGTKQRFYNNGTVADPTFEITYVWNGNRTINSIEFNKTVLNPNFTASKSGYTFLGWSTSASSTTVQTSLTATKDMTLYAVFKYPDKVLISSTQTFTISPNFTASSPQTLYSINTSMYPTHNVTAHVSSWSVGNSTGGVVTSSLYIDGTSVRGRKAVAGETTDNGGVGASGATFTLSNKSGNLTSYVVASSGAYVASDPKVYVDKLEGIGATVVG